MRKVNYIRSLMRSHLFKKKYGKLFSIIFVFVLLFALPVKVNAGFGSYGPRNLEEWLNKNFSYDYERASYIEYDCYALSLEKFVELKKGTCKDFAYANAVFLRRMGYEPFYVHYQVGNDWHVVTAFKWTEMNDELYVFDAWILRGPYKSIDEISSGKEYVRPFLDTYMCLWR